MKTITDRKTGEIMHIMAEMTVLEMESRIIRVDRGGDMVLMVQINVDDDAPTGSVLDPWENVSEYPYTEEGLTLALGKFGALSMDLPETMGSEHLKDLADDI